MHFAVSRVRARLTSVLLVVAAHILAFIAILQIRVPPEKEVDDSFTSVMFFISEAPGAPAAPAAAIPLGRRSGERSATSMSTATDDVGTAITLPSPTAPPSTAASPKTDWYGQLEGAADATLESVRQREAQAGALTRKYRLEPDPRDPHAAGTKGFRWYDAGIHRIDTRGSIPVLHVNERCVLLAFIIPACVIGHIEAHGDLFDDAERAQGERLATAGPNDVP
jgi:hypothetical protein